MSQSQPPPPIPVYAIAPLSPPPPPRPTNTLGILGFILSLLGLLTCGCFSPVGLVVSTIAIFKHPRGLAIAGLVLGLVGSAWGVIALLLGIFTVIISFFALLASAVGLTALAPHIITEVRMNQAAEVLVAHRNTDGTFPTDLTTLTELSQDDRNDAWGHALRVVPQPDGKFHIVSDGPDGLADTPDDLTSEDRPGEDRPHRRKRRVHVD